MAGSFQRERWSFRERVTRDVKQGGFIRPKNFMHVMKEIETLRGGLTLRGLYTDSRGFPPIFSVSTNGEEMVAGAVNPPVSRVPMQVAQVPVGPGPAYVQADLALDIAALQASLQALGPGAQPEAVAGPVAREVLAGWMLRWTSEYAGCLLSLAAGPRQAGAAALFAQPTPLGTATFAASAALHRPTLRPADLSLALRFQPAAFHDLLLTAKLDFAPLTTQDGSLAACPASLSLVKRGSTNNLWAGLEFTRLANATSLHSVAGAYVLFDNPYNDNSRIRLGSGFRCNGNFGSDPATPFGFVTLETDILARGVFAVGIKTVNGLPRFSMEMSFSRSAMDAPPKPVSTDVPDQK